MGEKERRQKHMEAGNSSENMNAAPVVPMQAPTINIQAPQSTDNLADASHTVAGVPQMPSNLSLCTSLRSQTPSNISLCPGEDGGARRAASFASPDKVNRF